MDLHQDEGMRLTRGSFFRLVVARGLISITLCAANCSWDRIPLRPGPSSPSSNTRRLQNVAAFPPPEGSFQRHGAITLDPLQFRAQPQDDAMGPAGRDRMR